jgi:hypothetical protein
VQQNSGKNKPIFKKDFQSEIIKNQQVISELKNYSNYGEKLHVS